MALISSTKVNLGFKAPNFNLLDVVTQEMVNLQGIKSKKATVIMFICNHCPYVKHIEKQLVLLAKDYQPKSIVFVGINSNDAKKYPEDSPEMMKEKAIALGYTFPYLYDESQEVARSYNAECTPEFYIFNDRLKCVYKGQFDDSRVHSPIEVTGKDIRSALDSILSKKPINSTQKESIGCSIKWKDA